jgi:hypothetical protein
VLVRCPEARRVSYAILPAEHRPPVPRPPTLPVPTGDARYVTDIYRYDIHSKAHMILCLCIV